MPELPEVEITKRKLESLLVGKRILSLGNKRITDLERRGKAVLIYLSTGKILAFHQRMSGKILVVDKNYTDKYIRFKYRLSSGKNLVFHDVRKFGVKWYGDTEKVLKDPYFKRLGPDPLKISFDKFKDIFSRHKGRIKQALLRQDLISGIGNIIADESLWKAEIHPLKKIEEFSNKEFRNLYDSIKYILNKSLLLGGSTMRDWYHPDNSKGGYYEKRFIYGRAKEKCRRCGNIIVRIKAAGRGTFICTKCQPKAGKSK